MPNWQEKKSLERRPKCQPGPEPSAGPAYFPMGFKPLDGKKEWDFQGMGSQLGSNPSKR